VSDLVWDERQVTVGEHTVFVRMGPEVPGTTPVVHVHGFGISGKYLLPTAALLSKRWTTLVPDLPGYGRSSKPQSALGIPALARVLIGLLDELELEKAVLLGNSMGSPVSLEVAHQAPDRVAGVVLVSPAGGMHNQPFARALRQLAKDSLREQPSMARIAVPDYVNFGPVATMRSFAELVEFPSLERMLRAPVPTLAVIGTRDPLMPHPRRVREIASLAPPYLTLAVIEGAAHAMNFSHAEELAHVVSCWLDGEEITDDPDAVGVTRVLKLPRETPDDGAAIAPGGPRPAPSSAGA
jgi:pimeloyl-ACP methyl ester carboxylesterase